MTVDVNITTFVAGTIALVIPAVIGWLIVRAIKSVDLAIAGLSEKVENLVQQHTETKVEMADLRARVVHLEYLMIGRAAP